MADESEGIDIKLSEEDSPADILRESEDISLFADDDSSGEALTAADLKLDDDLSDSEEDDLKLGMDEIGDLVDEIKLDDQEEEKADASEDGEVGNGIQAAVGSAMEEDMVFEEDESQVGDSVESVLDELGEEESVEKSTDDELSAGEEGSEESQEDAASVESDKVNEEEIVVETDGSENVEVSAEPESSPESEAELIADTEIPEEPESDATADSDEQMEDEPGSPDVMDMLHDPEVSEESNETESTESEDLDLGMEELDDTVEEETTKVEVEEAVIEPPVAEESEIDVLEDLAEPETEEAEELSEESSSGLNDMSEEKSAAESGVQDDPEIENEASEMHQELNKSEENASSLGSKMLLSLHHEAVVEIARTTLTGEEITQITYGSIIELDKAAGEPVELVIEGRTIARGEIVQINNDKLGIRIVGIV